MDASSAVGTSPAVASSSTVPPSLLTAEPASMKAPTEAEPSTSASQPIDAAASPADVAADPSTTTSGDPPISKSALKRQRKQEAFQAQKLQRRAYEKEKRKAKAAEVKRLVSEGKMDKPVNNKKRSRGKQVPHGARIAVDMGFDELMTDKEAKSMASQLAYCYSANRSASHPFPLLVTSFNGRLRETYEKRGDHASWKGVEWWEEGIEQLYEGVDEPAPSAHAGAEPAVPVAQPAASTSLGPSPNPVPEPAPPASTSTDAPSEPSTIPLVAIGALSGRPRTRVPRSTVVYLTGDSPNVLSTLEAGHTYILGGIVDRNRYKNLCLDKAASLGIAHAQLPIGEHLPEMQTRKVLTVNQVYEILVGWVEEGGRADGWREALRRVMPERKFDADGRKKRRRGQADDGAGGEGDGGREGAEGVYIARDEEEGDEEDEEMIVEQVDAAREEAQGKEPRVEAGAVGASVDAAAEP